MYIYIQSVRIRVIGRYEPADMDAKRQTQAFCKSTKCSSLRSHLSSPSQSPHHPLLFPFPLAFIPLLHHRHVTPAVSIHSTTTSPSSCPYMLYMLPAPFHLIQHTFFEKVLCSRF